MRSFVMFVTAVCVLFLIKLRWPKKKNLYGFLILFDAKTADQQHFTKITDFLERTTITNRSALLVKAQNLSQYVRAREKSSSRHP